MVHKVIGKYRELHVIFYISVVFIIFTYSICRLLYKILRTIGNGILGSEGNGHNGLKGQRGKFMAPVFVVCLGNSADW